MDLDLNKDTLSEGIRLLSERNFQWPIPINNLALIYNTGTKQELRARYDFGVNA